MMCNTSHLDCSPFSILEQNFRRKLKGTRAANLVQLTDTTQLLVQHVGRLTEVRCCEGRLNGPKVRMIEDIESFRAELQRHLFCELELSPECRIHLPNA